MRRERWTLTPGDGQWWDRFRLERLGRERLDERRGSSGQGFSRRCHFRWSGVGIGRRDRDGSDERRHVEEPSARRRGQPRVAEDLDATDVHRYRSVDVLRRHGDRHHDLVAGASRLDLFDGGRNVHDGRERRALLSAAGCCRCGQCRDQGPLLPPSPRFGEAGSNAQRRGWGLTQRIAYCDEAIAGNSRGESDDAASVGPRRPTSGVL